MPIMIYKLHLLTPPIQADYSQVLDHTLDIFRRKFCYFRENIASMNELFEATFSSVAGSGRPMSR